MGLSIHSDPVRPAGGFAILKGPGLKGVSAILVEHVPSGLFLGVDGRWVKHPHAFAVGSAAAGEDTLRLGPDIVAVIPSHVEVALRAGDGRDLGRLVWGCVIPSRGGEERSTPRPPEPEVAAWPPKRRSFALAGTIGAMVAVGLTAGVYMVWHEPLPPDPDGGPRCARLFDARLHAARGGTDADLVRLSDEALAARCGKQAFDAVDAVDWETSETSAWTLARFHDPDETAPVYRQAALADPTRAAALYLAWAPRSARMAEALKALCASHGPTLDGDPALRRGCGR